MADQQFISQLKGYSLITAEILYHLPDYPKLLQSFVWQEYDMAPRFPKLHGFLEFWDSNIEGKVNRVRVCTKRLIDPAEFRHLDARFELH
jgi:uncharacterized protein Usg